MNPAAVQISGLEEFPKSNLNSIQINTQQDSGKIKEWIRAVEAIEIFGIKKRTFHYKCDKGVFTSRWVNGNGGKQREVLVKSIVEKLPAKERVEFYERFGGSLQAEEIADKCELDVYSSAPEYSRKKADKYLSVLNASKGLKGNELRSFIEEWNCKYPEAKTSYARVVDARKLYDQNGISGLLAEYGKNAGKSKIDDDDYEYFKSLFLQLSRPSVQKCWLSTIGYATKKAMGEIPVDYPSANTFYRQLLNRVTEPGIFLARYGKAAYNKKYLSYANRDYSNIYPGQVWVSDHRQLDVAVMHREPKNIQEAIRHLLKYGETKKKPNFVWFTVWRDFLTCKWLGWSIHIEDPNSDHIYESFFNAVEKYGLPEEIIIDNGKDYRCKDFAGGRKRFAKVQIDEIRARSLMENLGIEVHFALPYNAQTKPIERDFKIQKEWFDKGLPGYRGGNVIEKPETLAADIKAHRMLDYDEFAELLEYFITEILDKYESQGKNLLGKSRYQFWAENFTGLRRISRDAMKLFAMRASGDLTIRRNGLTVDQRYNLYYWAEWMTPLKGKKAYMRRDRNNYGEAWVFASETDEYLGKAFLNALDTAAIARTELEKETLSAVMGAKRREMKLMKHYGQAPKIDPHAALINMAAGIAVNNLNDGSVSAADITQTIIHKTELDELFVKEEELKRTGTNNELMLSKIMNGRMENEQPELKVWQFEADEEVED